MNEGLDKDDKFRMVEDEFLTVAQSFTVYLHAAEYKKQQKMVKNRNAETIDSISRPVTGKMPDQTRRKIESVARSKQQRRVVQGLLGKKKDGGLSDSDDDTPLPYIGTTLHGLMDSPRKKAASLATLGSIAATTRSAAGFDRPATQSKAQKRAIPSSPQPKSVARRASTKDGAETQISDDEDDDDLDAPILAPRFNIHERKSTKQIGAVPKSDELPSKTLSLKPIPAQRPRSPPPKALIKTESTYNPIAALVKSEATSHSFDDLPDFASRPSRLERARQRKTKREDPDQDKKNLDEIPSFF